LVSIRRTALQPFGLRLNAIKNWVHRSSLSLELGLYPVPGLIDLVHPNRIVQHTRVGERVAGGSESADQNPRIRTHTTALDPPPAPARATQQSATSHRCLAAAHPRPSCDTR